MENENLQKIKAAEKLIVMQTKVFHDMEREAKADDTVTPQEQKGLDKVSKKIKKLKNLIKEARADFEKNKKDWKARDTEWRSVQLQCGELRDWPHKDGPAFIEKCLAIQRQEAAQLWKDASKALDALGKSLKPVYEMFLTQVEASKKLAELQMEYREQLSRVEMSTPISEAIAAEISALKNEYSSVISHEDSGDYIQALAILTALMPKLDTIKESLKTLAEFKTQFDSRWAAIQPRLAETTHCEFPDLLPMQEDLSAMADSISESAAAHDYETALGLLDSLSANIDTFMVEYAKAVDERTLYESRLPALQAQIGEVSISEFPALSDQQNELNAEVSDMEAAAASGDYAGALLTMDAVVPLIDGLRAAIDNARLGQQFEEKMSEMEPRFAEALVSIFGVLDAMTQSVDQLRIDAESAGAAGEYDSGLAILLVAEGQIAALLALVSAHQTAQDEYERRSGAIFERYDAIAQCEYPQLETQAQELVSIRSSIDTAVANGDYLSALNFLNELDALVSSTTQTVADLDAARVSYETRLSGVISRFDSLMVCDFAELEDDRARLETLRGEMESTAEGRDFPEAIRLMDELERELDALEAQMGELDSLRAQYEELYEKIKDKIAAVESCDHAELKPKKDAILATRDEMIAAADSTDFATAKDKANDLIAPLEEFARLEVAVEDYIRGLSKLEPRLKEARALTYKSLDDDKKAIEDSYTKMTGHAAVIEYQKAVDEMAKLNDMITAILKLNETLKLKEAVYNDKKSDLDDSLEPLRKNEIKEAAKEASDAASAYDEMVKLGDAHEFIEALEKVDGIKKLIQAYIAKVDQFGDAKEAYEIVRKLAETALSQAKEKADDYDELEEAYKTLETLKSDMETSAEKEDWAEAKSKANAIISGAEKLSEKHSDLKSRFAELKGKAENALAQFEQLPDDAEERAESEFKTAKKARDALKDAVDESDYDALKDALEDYTGKMEELSEALKTEGEHQSEYEGLRDSFIKRIEDAGDSDVAEFLDDELDKVSDAFKEMVEIAEEENDFEGAVKEASAVEQALKEFDDAEDTMLVEKTRYEERISGLEKQFNEASEVKDESLESEVDKMKKMRAEAVELARKGEFEKAAEKAKELRPIVEGILDTVEAKEDEEAEKTKKELEEEKDDGILEDAGEFLDDVKDKAIDFVKDKAFDKATDYLGKKAKVVVTTGKNVLEELADGDPIDALVEAGKGYAELNPVTDTIKDGLELIDETLEISDKVLGDDD